MDLSVVLICGLFDSLGASFAGEIDCDLGRDIQSSLSRVVDAAIGAAICGGLFEEAARGG